MKLHFYDSQTLRNVVARFTGRPCGSSTPAAGYVPVELLVSADCLVAVVRELVRRRRFGGTHTITKRQVKSAIESGYDTGEGWKFRCPVCYLWVEYLHAHTPHGITTKQHAAQNTYDHLKWLQSECALQCDCYY